MAIRDTSPTFQEYMPVITRVLNQSGGSGYNYNPVAADSVSSGVIQTGTRENPNIRPAIKVSGPNQQVPKTVGTVTDPGMVGRNIDLSGAYKLNPGEVIMNEGTKDAIVVGEGAPRGGFGIPRAGAGLIDWITNKSILAPVLPDTDLDKRGGGRDYGNLPTTGLGRKPTLDPAKVAEINKQVGAVDPTKPTTSPVLSPEDQARVIAGEIEYKEALIPANIKVQQAQHEQRMKELGQMLPFLQKSILDARLATETYSPAEIQNRMAKATSALAADRLSMAGMQDAATRLVAATAPRSFGQRA